VTTELLDAHVPRVRFTPDQKRALADALNQSLVQALNLPEGDRFISITEHGEGELHLIGTRNDSRCSRTLAITRLPPSCFP
jgi:phenylpyruvate tautomerase PptA (4-oxalocrotonate tautomerase family)